MPAPLIHHLAPTCKSMLPERGYVRQHQPQHAARPKFAKLRPGHSPPKNPNIGPKRILKGFRLSARGCEERATLGKRPHCFSTPTEGVPKFNLINCKNWAFFEIFQNFIRGLREVQMHLYRADGLQKIAALWFGNHGRGSEQCHCVCQQTQDPS